MEPADTPEIADALTPLPRGLLFVGARLNLDLYDGMGVLIHRAGRALADEAEVETLRNERPLVRSFALRDLRDSRWGLENAHRFVVEEETSDGVAGPTARKKLPRKMATAKTLAAYFALARNDPQDLLYCLETTLRVALHEPDPGDFTLRVGAVAQQISRAMTEDPDRTLLGLIFEASREIAGYTVRHSLLVACVSLLTLRQARLSAPQDAAVQAALVMNVAMADLQNQLAFSGRGLSETERRAVQRHPQQGVEMLQRLGVDDDFILDVVRDHHEDPPAGGRFEDLPPARQVALVVRASDIFMSRLSPRQSRPALSAFMAAKCFFVQNQVSDEAAALVLRAIGIFPPGVMVRLANEDLAVVVARGDSMMNPVVACVMDASGAVPSRPYPREAQGAQLRIVATTTPVDVRVLPNLASLMSLRVGRGSRSMGEAGLGDGGSGSTGTAAAATAAGASSGEVPSTR